MMTVLILPCRRCGRTVKVPCHDPAGYYEGGPWDFACADWFNGNVSAEEIERQAGVVTSAVGPLDGLPDTDAGDLPSSTPAARWREKGEADPHANAYDVERARLCGGHLTDDEVAFQTAMLSPRDLNHEAVLTTAKDRIRWLSRALERALAAGSR